MASLKAALVILAIFCCNLEVHSQNHETMTKSYSRNGQLLIIGKHHLKDQALAYALCQYTSDDSKMFCDLMFETNMFSNTDSSYQCRISLFPEMDNGLIYDILEVYVWDLTTVILVWREVARDFQTEQMVFKTVYLKKCAVKDHRLPINSYVAMKPEIFIMPYDNQYDIAFVNEWMCPNFHCKLTVQKYGDNTHLEPWMINTALIYDVQHIDIVNKELIVMINRQNGNVEFLLNNGDVSNMVPLLQYDSIEGLVWSSAYGTISICSCALCSQYDYNGEFILNKNLKIAQPCNLIAIHNLYNWENLAIMVDSSDNDNYRIAKINLDGKIGNTININELKRWQKLEFINSQFFENDEGKHCVSTFSALSSDLDSIQATLDCFTLDYLS